MSALIAPNFLIISTLLVGSMGLFVPYATKEDSLIRSFLLIAVSIFFLVNVLIIDWLFLNNVEAKFTLFSIEKYSISLALEPLGLIFLTMLASLWPCALMYTTPFLRINKMEQSGNYLMFINACVLTGCVIALSANLFTMIVGYEILTLCTVPLISYTPNKKVIAGLINYLKILMITGLVLFLPAIIIIYAKIGHGEFTNNGFLIGHFSDHSAIILLLMFVFGISKAALYPFHKWLPAAMVASYPVSALLHAVVVVKAGLFCIYKVFIYVFGLGYLQYLFKEHNWLIYLPIITIIYSSLQALKCDQIKMILAYSTINQLSIALLGAFLFTPKGLAAAVIHMVSHSLSKICLFYAAGNIYSVKGVYKISQLLGIYRDLPKTSFIFLIATLSLIGMPPFAGFVSKFFIMLAAAEAENIPTMIALVMSTMLSAIYMVKILIFMYRPVNNNLIANVTMRTIGERKLPTLMIISLWFCLAGVVLFFFIVQAMNKFLIYL